MKTITLIIVVFGVVLLAACGGGGLYGGGSTATPTATTAPATGATGTATSAATPTPTGTAAVSGAATKVSIKNFAFNPASVTIKAGDTVEWTNDDSTTHTVTGTDFDSGDLAPGSTFSHQFTSAGTFDYHCSIHTFMTGSVVVQ